MQHPPQPRPAESIGLPLYVTNMILLLAAALLDRRPR